MIRGQLADVAHQTVLCSCCLDFGIEINLHILVKELVFVNVYLPKIVDNKKL